MTLLRIYTASLLTMYLTYADNWLGNHGFLLFRAKIFLIISLFVYNALVLFQGARGYRMIECNIIRNLPVIAPFAAMASVSLMGSSMPDAYAGDESMYFKEIPISFVVFFLSMTIPLFGFFMRRWRFYLTIPFFVLVGSIFLDLYAPSAFSRYYGRAAGLAWEPNVAALGVILLCTVIVEYGRFRYMDLAIIALAFLAVFATLSRGGLIVATLFTLTYAIKHRIYSPYLHKNLKNLLTLGVGACATVTLIVLGVTYLVDHSDMFTNAEAQHRLNMLTLRDDFATDPAAIERRLLVERALVLVEEIMATGTRYGLHGYIPGTAT